MFIQQISVFIENRHGSLTDFTKLLGDNGVDLIALSIADTTNFGILRAIVSDNEKTLKVVRDKGYTANLTEVLAVAVPDAPGGLAPVLALLAEGDIDIEYMYSLFSHQEGKAYMVFRVSDEEKFVKLLASKGMETVSNAELGLK